MRLHLASRVSTKNEIMAPLHVATLAVQRELPKYEITFSSTKNEIMAPLHVAVKESYEIICSMVSCTEVEPILL